jgi:succinate dehydrogenase hydrophobic anchor subunit
MENIVADSTVVLAGLAFALVIFFVLIVIFKWLWNITMPDVFGIKEVTFWQAFRILILASILFGGHRTIQQGADMGTDAMDEGSEEQSQ